jgi:hypothetical protein
MENKPLLLLKPIQLALVLYALAVLILVVSIFDWRFRPAVFVAGIWGLLANLYAWRERSRDPNRRLKLTVGHVAGMATGLVGGLVAAFVVGIQPAPDERINEYKRIAKSVGEEAQNCLKERLATGGHPTRWQLAGMDDCLQRRPG